MPDSVATPSAPSASPVFSSNIPQPRLSAAGVQAPSAQEVLEGVIEDMQEAFGEELAFYDAAGKLLVSRPMTQLAGTLAATLNANAGVMCEMMNMFDPATSSGVMQDALCALYGLTRKQGLPTVVEGVVTGAPGVVIPQGALVADTAGNQYQAEGTATIGADGTARLTFSCTVEGAVACPKGALSSLVSAIPNWFSVTNPVEGIPGQEVETSAQLEARRQASLSSASTSSTAAILGRVLAVEGVMAATVIANDQDFPVNGLAPHSVGVTVLGGADDAIAQAIYSKIPPGVPSVGTVRVAVQDTAPIYTGANGNGPVYEICFSRVTEIALGVKVTLADTDDLPTDAISQVQQVVASWFTDKATRPQLGSKVYASRLSCTINALGNWADVLSCMLVWEGQEHSSWAPAQGTFPVCAAEDVSVTVSTS